MKIGIVLLCRYNSNRLPGKILKEINGQPVLEIILNRLKASTKADQIIVCTSDQSSDDPIVEYCKNEEVNYFRGSLNNVSERFLACANAYKLDWAVRVNGDNIFTDYRLIDQGIELISKGNYDFISNVEGRTYPTGMSVELVKTSTYKHYFNKISERADWQEHVTLFFYENIDLVKKRFFYNHSLETAKGTKLALDTEEDFKKAKWIIDEIKGLKLQTTWQEISNVANRYA